MGGQQSSRGRPYPRHKTTQLGQTSQHPNKVSRDNADTVPVVFTWTQGAQDVKLCIEAFGWKEIPMVRSGIDFHVVYELPRGKHRYNFLVDGETSFAPDQLTDTLLECGEEKTVNLIDLDDFDKNAFLEEHAWSISDSDLTYSQRLRDISEYTADAPQIPSLLNKSPYICIEPPPRVPVPNVPLHCICGHVYHDLGCVLRRFGLSVILTTTTRRYERKYSTTVFLRRHHTGLSAEIPTGAGNPLRLCVRRRPSAGSPKA